MKLSIIVPVYNEEKTIHKILGKVQKVNLGCVDKEIIIVDDCSTDRTREILRGIHYGNVLIIHHSRNKGKGGAVKTGLKYSTGEIIIIQDADLEYDPRDYNKVIQPILDGRSKVVYGSRFLKGGAFSGQKWAIPSHFFGNKLLSCITSLLYGQYITDMETCYKSFDRKTILSLRIKSDGFDIEPEITAKLLKRRVKILEVPISYNSRGFKEGKKINWVDGIKALAVLIRYKFKD